MLQFINNHRKSFVGLFGVVIVAFLMTGFGVDMGPSGANQAGITVNDTEIPAERYYEERRSIENRMRMFMGDRLDAILPTLDLGQQAVDSLISRALILEHARGSGMRASEAEVQDVLLNTGLFRDGYDPEIYRSYLLQIGKSSTQFEAELQDDALVGQFMGLIRDAGNLSAAELRSVVRSNETQYSVAKVEIDPKNLVGEVPDPDKDTLAKFFENNASDYETSPAVAYDYLVFDPKDFLDSVEILPEDVEAYYLDNESKFVEPESVKARHIQLNFDTDRDPKKMVELKERADKIREEAISGKLFEDLVQQHTDDYATREQGGDLGWLVKGQHEPAFDKAVFAVKEGGIAELIQTEYGYQIVKVESYKPMRPKELDEVRSEIESIIRKDEAPGYTSAHAIDLFEKWEKAGGALSEFAVQEGLTAASSNGVKKLGEDPQNLIGLTKAILEREQEKRQLVEIGEKSVLVSVTEYRPSDIPLLDEVKDKVLSRYKGLESKTLARKKGEGLIESLAKGAYPNLDEAAKAVGLTSVLESGIKKAGSSPGVFASPEVREALFAVHTPNTRLDKVFEAAGKLYLLEVREITPPSPEDVDKKIKDLRNMENNQSGQMLVASIVNALKTKAEIEVSPNLPITQ